MMDPAVHFESASRLLDSWADLYHRGAFRISLPSGGWQAADDLLRIAKTADRLASDRLGKALAKSNETLRPLVDPLAIDLGAHRWLSSEREEAYSDWLEWILKQIAEPRWILKLFGVRDGMVLAECASERPDINREVKILDGHGRLDLLIRFGNRLLVVVEIKTKLFDEDDVLEQLKKYELWILDQHQETFATFIAVEPSQFSRQTLFEPLQWRELALRIREQARQWVSTGNGKDLLCASMSLAFCGAVEQDSLRFSGKQMLFRTLLSTEYLEEWIARNGG